MTTRALPDVEVLVPLVLTDHASVDHGSRIPPDVATQLPYRAIYKIGGTSVHPRLMDRPQVQIACLAATREAASDLAESARVDLHAAVEAQTRTTAGVVHKVVEIISPFEVRTSGQPDGVFRFDATYQIYTRP